MVETERHSWYPILSSSQTVTALDIAREVATRLRESDQIETAVARAAKQTHYPRSVHWQSRGIAQGYAGLAVMCAYLDMCFPEQNWDETAHRYMTIAVQDAMEQSQQSTGIAIGLSGLAFAAWYLSKGGKRYRKLLTAIEGILLPLTMVQAHRLAEQKKIFCLLSLT